MVPTNVLIAINGPKTSSRAFGTDNGAPGARACRVREGTS